MLFEHIFKELEAHKVKYLVIGGIAVNLHGFARATGDLDIMISYDDSNVEAFLMAAGALDLTPKIPVKLEEFSDPSKREMWQNSKNMKVFSLRSRN